VVGDCYRECYCHRHCPHAFDVTAKPRWSRSPCGAVCSRVGLGRVELPTSRLSGADIPPQHPISCR
jgi:hypothetical protein